MGKINEYQRRQLASSAVGIAAPDKSGQIVGSAISQAGRAISKREAEIRDNYTTVQANTALMQFGLSFQKFGAQAQRETAANPDAYPEKILEGGEQMLQEFANGISDEMVRNKFLAAAGTVVRAGVNQAGAWAEAKKKDNAVIAAQDALRLGSITTGKTLTKEELLISMETVRGLAADEIPDDVLGAKDKKDFLDKSMPNALESHFSNRVLHDPQQLITDLKNGEYDKVPYFTNDMKVTFTKQAETRVRQEKVLTKQAQTDNFQGAMNQFLLGELGFDTIDALASAPTEAEGISTTQAVQLRKAVVLQAEADAAKLVRSDEAAKQYIDLIYAVFDNRIDRAIALEKMVNVYRDGIITRDEARFLSETRASLQEVLTESRSNGIIKGLEIISNKVRRLWLGENKTKEAVYIRSLVDQTAQGISPTAATTKVLQKMDVDKVLEENPALAAFEDPVKEAYRLRAVQDLTTAGYPVTTRNVDALIADYIAEDNKKKE